MSTQSSNPLALSTDRPTEFEVPISKSHFSAIHFLRNSNLGMSDVKASFARRRPFSSRNTPIGLGGLYSALDTRTASSRRVVKLHISIDIRLMA
jgi:hypothetical protein